MGRTDWNTIHPNKLSLTLHSVYRLEHNPPPLSCKTIIKSFLGYHWRMCVKIIHPFIHLFIHSLCYTCWFLCHSFIHSFIYSSIQGTIHVDSCVTTEVCVLRSFVHSFIYSSIHPFKVLYMLILVSHLKYVC